MKKIKQYNEEPKKKKQAQLERASNIIFTSKH